MIDIQSHVFITIVWSIAFAHNFVLYFILFKDKHRSQYEVAGGSMDPQETPITNALRELKEESVNLFRLNPNFNYNSRTFSSRFEQSGIICIID